MGKRLTYVKIYRHWLNTDSDGGRGSDSDGDRGGVRLEYGFDFKKEVNLNNLKRPVVFFPVGSCIFHSSVFFLFR